ncbi:sensor histidine kinase [Salisediminibacterium selenitireducens]|uniref:histidine kinase n=1 Tax=Bacillus selenitireducens (strain ATCC 700615 / DSM 15326 / MLS10) TaxID=439292 RepID=D6XXD0_BACIE|nr:histidine kinase [Salisediminibacterium selenitireducens]ADH97987.1 integral membrane sensor signal transduction histidine kinase [[Bacillus] selenitireducens MLS10]
MNRLRRQIFSKSYSRRIQFMFALFILLPTITLSIITYQSDKQNIAEKMDFYNETIIDVIANDIDKLTNDLIFSSHFLIQDKGFKSAIAEISDRDGIQSLTAFQQFEYIRERFLSMETRTLNQNISMFYLNDAGLIVTSRSMPLSQEDIQRQWLSVSENLNLQTEMIIQYLGKSYDGSQHYFTRVIPRDLSTGNQGLLTIIVSDDYFQQLFEPVSSGAIRLNDDKGNMIAGSEIDTAARDSLLERTVSPFGWSLYYETPSQQINEELNQSFYSSLMIIFFLFVVFIMLSMKSARQLSRPVEELKLVADQFSQGNRGARFQVTGEDEIQSLGVSVNHMLDEINDLIERIEKKETQKRELELHALYEQIRPHFLMNTLNSIRCSLEMEDDEFHSKKLYSLTMLLRKYLKINEPSTLRNEVELLTHYIDIMEMRKGRSYWLKAWLSEETHEVEIPFLTLQPIIENAILHAFEDPEHHPIMEIRAEIKDEWFHVTVWDNGSGISQSKVDQLNRSLKDTRLEYSKQQGDSLGLVNIAERLKLTFSERATLVINSERGKGTTVQILIPVSDMKGE